MGKYIGIDFGMQNLKVCYYDGIKNRRVDLEGNQQSISKVVKNAVFYTENEDKILTKFFFDSLEAEEARKWGDPDYVRYIKRELQKEKYTRSLCDGKYTFTAVQIAIDIFKQIIFKMNESRYDITAPTILTIPVVFSEAQKAVLKFCAESAGFQVQEIITEPFAALFSEEIFDACADIDSDEEDYVLMFDFGASTLDICLLKLENEANNISVETVSSTGLSYGGKDITDAISQFLMEKEQTLIEQIIEAGRLDQESAAATFFEYAEELKNELYEEEDTPEAKKDFFGSQLILKRTNVDKLLESLKIWDKIKKQIEEMFDATDEFDHDDYSIVSKVVMTGGTSRIQYFRDKMEELFEDAELIGDVEEEDTIYCSVSSGAVNYAKKNNISIKNSSPMCIGIVYGNGFEMALHRNSFYYAPGKRKQLQRKWLENNNWKIKVYQTLDQVREHANVDQEGIFFAGYIQLNKNLYASSKEDVYISLLYTPNGIVANTAMSNEIKQLIEEHIPLTTEVSV